MQTPCNLLDLSDFFFFFFKNPKIICNMEIEQTCFFNDVSSSCSSYYLTKVKIISVVEVH